jgi:hypothetical protein
MGWDKTDDQFGIHRKVIRIPKKQRFAVVGLWTLAKNYSARALTDGVLEAHELDELDAPAPSIAELVRVELWHREACPRCIQKLTEADHPLPLPAGSVVVHDYLEYNPSRKVVIANREAERVRKASHRDSRRSSGGSPTGTPDVRDSESGHPVPDPVPSPLTDVTHPPGSSPVTDVSAEGLDRALVDLVEEKKSRALEQAARIGVKDLWALHGLLETASGLGMTPRGAVDLIEAILLKARDENVRDVDAYVATVCRNTPEKVREAYNAYDIGAVA